MIYGTRSVRNEIKFLYLKRQLNKELYSLNLINANEWYNMWNMIYKDINIKLNVEMERKYTTINKKTKTLEQAPKLFSLKNINKKLYMIG
jgi:hypothetical protein